MNKIKKIMKIVLVTTMVCVSLHVLSPVVDAAESNTDSLVMDKVANDNGDGTYTLRLTAHTEGKVSVITKSKPLDIILVLDQSGSMKDGIDEIVKYTEEYVLSISQTYYILNQSNKYIEVTATDEYFQLGFDHGFQIVRVWKDANGDRVFPLSRDGSNPDPEKRYPAVQFYNKSTINAGKQKLEVLKEAAQKFSDNVIANGGDHRIAIAGYASGETTSMPTEIPYVNTELFIGAKQYSQNGKYVNGGNSGVQLEGIKDMYSKAFQSTKDSAGQINIKSSLNALTSQGATRADLGMDMAYQILLNDKNTDKDRQKVVIMFTDGMPTSSNVFDSTVANDTISLANKMKVAGAKVFTIGVESSLNPAANPESSSTSDMNRYMQYVSSNYPNATSLTNAGTEGDYTSGKYLAASDEESLNKVFEAISEEISSSTSTLSEKTELIDYVSDYFSITNESDIKTYTQNYLGNDQWDSQLVPYDTATIDYNEKTKAIIVTGFDYSNEYIADTNPARGRRIVVEIKVKPNVGFIGGNEINTNKEESGIYDDQTFVKEFPVPKVSLPIDYQFSVNPQAIYIGSNLDKMTDLFDIDNTQDGLQFKNNDNQVYTIDGINNKFVEIKQEVKIDGVVVATYTIEAGKTTGTWDKELDFSSLDNNKSIDIGTKVTPTVTGNVVSQQGVSQSAIYVYKPVLTVEDQTIFLGEKINLDDSVKKVEWVNSKVNAVKPTGKAPTLEYDYVSKDGTLVRDSEGNYSVITDTDLTMIVKNGNKVITDHSTINNAGQHQGIDLKVQVVKGELTITKTIDAQYTHNDTLKANQTFVFKIDVRNEKDGDIIDSYYQTLSFSANEGLVSKSITIKGLQKGYYTISEVSDWSWKYTENVLGRKDNYAGNGTFSGLSENSNILIGDRDIISAGEGNVFYGCQSGTVINGKEQNSAATVSFINNIKDTNILGDNASAINKFKGN